MLNALSWVLKLTLLSVVILIAGEWIHWDGRSLAQHVMLGLGHAERSDTADYLREMTRKITEDARSGIEKKAKSLGRKTAAAHKSAGEAQEEALTDRTKMQAAAPMAAPVRNSARSEERLPPSERQKLKALIRELNGPND
jgi:hypothetical protein